MKYFQMQKMTESQTADQPHPIWNKTICCWTVLKTKQKSNQISDFFIQLI